jgi:hypothetical protein
MKFYSLKSHSHFEDLPYLLKAICFPSAGHFEVNLVISLEVSWTFSCSVLKLLYCLHAYRRSLVSKVCVCVCVWGFFFFSAIATVNGRSSKGHLAVFCLDVVFWDVLLSIQTVLRVKIFLIITGTHSVQLSALPALLLVSLYLRHQMPSWIRWKLCRILLLEGEMVHVCCLGSFSQHG